MTVSRTLKATSSPNLFLDICADSWATRSTTRLHSAVSTTSQLCLPHAVRSQPALPSAARAPALALHSAASMPQGRLPSTLPPRRRKGRALHSTTAMASLRRHAAFARPHPATPSPCHTLPCSVAPRTQGNERGPVEGAPSSRRSAPSPRGCDLQHLGLGFESLGVGSICNQEHGSF